MGTPRFHVDTNNTIKEYLSGKSIKQLASDYGCSRQVIYRVLRQANITPRNRSEAMKIRMANTSCEERKRLSHAAHEAKKGYTNSPETRHKMALAKNKKVGVFENDFIREFDAAGIPTTPQQAFLAYNFDIGCGPVAVEIEVQHGKLFTSPKIMKRVMECIECGMNMVYVNIPSKNSVIPTACYEKVISLVKICRSDPSIRGQYWMVRSTGEIYAAGGRYFD